MSYWLFKLKVHQPSESVIAYWTEAQSVKQLEFALKNGNYKTRHLAAKGLEQAGTSSSIPFLLNAVEDKIHSASIAALNALETLDFNNELSKFITRKRFYWAQKIKAKLDKEKQRKKKKSNIYRWERASKKSFEMVKERLKRPIR